MLFSSVTFLFYFLPLTLILYFAAPKFLKNSVLLLSSLFFYGWGEPRYLIFMIISVLQGYLSGILIEKFSKDSKKRMTKIIMIVSAVISLGLLGYCKYADFFIENFNAVTGLSVPLLKIALPIGISFYTFQILSYVADVYRKDVKAQKNIIDLAAYVAMFPQLIAGPIVRYSDIEPQLKNRKHTAEGIAYGTRRFVTGLAKKVLIANILGELAEAFRMTDDRTVLFAWLYAAAYVLHIYYDFSGYSDMAIGLGKIFGFVFPENFNYPYISGSITEFWRRWHMSLGSWFRDYLYIPLGGNRVSKIKWYRNIFIVWMATGFWHGAAWNFIAWGLMFGILLVAEKVWLLKKLEKIKALRHFYVMFFIVISFIIFDASDMSSAFKVIAQMFGAGGLPAYNKEAVWYMRSYAPVLVAAAAGSTPLFTGAVKKISQNDKGKTAVSILEPVFVLVLLAVSTAFLIDGSFNPFLYFRF